MNKITRVVAGALTALVVLGAFAAPASALESESLEETLCAAANADLDELTDLLNDTIALLPERGDAVDDAQAVMDASTEDVAAAALAYIRALDGTGDEDETLDAFVDAAVQFSEDVIGWIDAVNQENNTFLLAGVYDVNVNYINGICNPA